METFFLLAGVLVGAISVWLFLKNKTGPPGSLSPAEAQALNERINAANIEKGKSEARSQMLQKTCDEQKNQIEQLISRNTELTGELAGIQSNYKNLQQKFSEYKEEIEHLREKFTTEFRNIANDLLDEKSRKFTEQNKVNIDEILRPLGEKIKNFEQKVNDVYISDTQERSRLLEQIKNLHDLNQQMSKETASLTSALKGESKTQGNWGEFILETILEKSGLQKGREYLVQQSFSSEGGKRLQPDIIINLPENKSLVIDSKVSLTAYERYCSADNEVQASSALREHIASIRKHIKELSAKNYHNLYQIKTLDFVLLFMPVEPAFSLAVRHDPEVFNEAFGQNIVIVSPSTLLATLRTIASIWRQEHQNKNALEIARQGGAMYDKICGIVEDMLDLGKKISNVGAIHEEIMKKLHTGGGNLLRKAENMKKLGAKTNRTLPSSLIEDIDEDDGTDLLLEENKNNGN